MTDFIFVAPNFQGSLGNSNDFLELTTLPGGTGWASNGSLPGPGDTVQVGNASSAAINNYMTVGNPDVSGQLSVGTWEGGITLLPGSSLTVNLYQDYFDTSFGLMGSVPTSAGTPGVSIPTTIDAGATLTTNILQVWEVFVYGTLNATTVTNDTGIGSQDPGDHANQDNFPRTTIYVFSGGTVTIGSSTAIGFVGELSGGSLTATNDLNLGQNGILNISGGGTATIQNTIEIGSVSADTDLVEISGARSALDYNGSMPFVIGDAGTATFEVLSGASQKLPDLTVGNQQGGSGTVQVSGSTLTVNGMVTIGAGGSGTATIEAGATATFSGDVTVGDLATGSGTLTVTGSGSTLTTSGTNSAVVIGGNGTASATVGSGATFNAAASAVSVDGNSNANTLSIDGAGSTMEAKSLSVDTVGVGLGMVVVSGGDLTVNGDVDLGAQVAGELQVSNNGTLTVNGNVQIGGLNGSNGFGDLEILSGSNFHWNGDFTIGGPDQLSQLLISGGSTAMPMGGSSHGSIDVVGPNSIIEVEGAGSQLSVQSLVLSNASSVTTDAKGVIVVGGAGANGTATSSPGSILVNPLASITGVGELGNGGTLTINVNGTIESENPVGSYSDLYLDAATVTGAGQVLIGAGTTLTLNAADTVLAMTFAGTTATLELEQPPQFGAAIANLQVGDSIQLDGTTVNSADLDAGAGTLTITTSSGVNLTYDVAGSLDGNQFDVVNSNGNSVLTLEPQGQQPPPPLGPVVTAGNPHVTFAVGDAPVTLDPGVSVTDGESGTLIGATVRIMGGTFANDGDLLSVNTVGTSISAMYDSVDETLTLSGTASVQKYQAVLETVSFSSTATDPTNGGADPGRTIIWTVTDGIASSSPVTTTLNVESLLDEIYLSVLQRAASSAEVTAATLLQSTVGTTGMIASIVDSPEAQHNAYPIAQIVELATGNMPTTAQLAGWVPFVESHGLLQGSSQSNPLLDQMAEAFVASTAFGNTYNGGTAVDPNAPITASIVSAIIQAATGIAATQTQINAWLATGQTIDQVFVDFALGDQYSAHIQSTVQQYLTSLADKAASNGGLGVSTTITPNDGMTAAQVQGAYQAVLQRAPTAGETNAALSIDGSIGNVGSIAAIVDSPEAQQSVYPVTQIILLATGNPPSPAQLAGWVPAVETGTSLDNMALAFVASTQFGNTYNGGTAVDPNAPITASIVSAIIDAATGIAATQTQINAWLATGETIDQVFVSFALGDQYSAHVQSTVQAYLDATAINAAGLSTVDGINATGALTLGTSATPLTGNNLTILGGSGSLTVVATGNGDTITELNTSTAGGTITANGNGDIINLANGANMITANGTGDAINLGVLSTGTSITAGQTIHALGAGDTITFATTAADSTAVTWAAASTVDGGNSSTGIGSNSTVNFGNNTGGGSEAIVLTGDLTGATTAGGTTTTGIAMITLANIHDAAGDQIILNNATTELLAGTSPENVTGAGSLAQAFDLAAADAATSQAGGKIAANTGVIDWFQYGGNTYVLEAINDTAGAAAHPALAATDELIKIVGLVSLSGESLAGHTLTL
jgi:T5SS/PEP-CTERM-associated repeat protein